jgi:putative NADH-flavin reductase
MIQLANDPNARRSWRPKARADQQALEAQRRGQTGHSWPFLSPHANRAERPAENRHPSNDSGS